MDRLRRADSLPQGGRASCNLLRAWTEQKGRGIKSECWAETLVFGGLWTQTELTPPAPLGLLGLFSFRNHLSQFHITHLSFWFAWVALFWFIYILLVRLLWWTLTHTTISSELFRIPCSLFCYSNPFPLRLLFLIITTQSQNVIKHLKYELSSPKHPVFTFSQLHYVFFYFTI